MLIYAEEIVYESICDSRYDMILKLVPIFPKYQN